ncbi:MAG TPA: sulfatase-like hydrolase/transferase [Polyangiaceae bacterium]|nr:sulfatase-like hydrolase/transferase [Polyangiaceae bacterium]
MALSLLRSAFSRIVSFVRHRVIAAPTHPRRIPWRIALAWVFSFASIVDILLGQSPPIASVIAAAGLGLGMGAIFGSMIDGMSYALFKLPPWISRIFWLLPGLACSFWLTRELGILARLHGPYRQLAIDALVATSCAGLALGGTFAAAQPTPRFPHGWLASRPFFRWILAILFLSASGAMIWADRNLFEQLYPSAHLALQLVSLWAIAAVIVSIGPIPRMPPRIRLTLLSLSIILALLPYVLVRDADSPTTDRILHRPFPALAIAFHRNLTDVDRDGYSSLLGGGDCEPWLASANPGAAEIPDNGIDDNCRYGDRITQLPSDEDEPIPTLDGPAPSIVLITLDAVVHDHMSVYGYERDTTPNLKRFAENAVVFHRAYTTATWTALAIPSLLRGVYARRLRWTRVAETNRYRLLRTHEYDQLQRTETLRLMFGLPLEEPRPPISQRLQSAGYHTIASLDDGYSEFLSEKSGVHKGFSVFRHVDSLPKEKRNDVGNTELALAALRSRPPDKPFMLWIHYFGPHDPSTKHNEVQSFGSSVTDLYDHEILFADHALSPLLEELDAIGKQRPLAVFVTSDHGEYLTSTRRVHGSGLHELTTHIPLIAKIPGVSPGNSDALVSLIDIPATILRLCGVRGAAGMDGVDLREVLTGKHKHRVLHSDTWRFKVNGEPWFDLTSAYDDQHKLLFFRHTNQMRLERRDDPNPQTTNLLDEIPIPKHLDDAMGAYMEQTGGPPDIHD